MREKKTKKFYSYQSGSLCKKKKKLKHENDERKKHTHKIYAQNRVIQRKKKQKNETTRQCSVKYKETESK